MERAAAEPGPRLVSLRQGTSRPPRSNAPVPHIWAPLYACTPARPPRGSPVHPPARPAAPLYTHALMPGAPPDHCLWGGPVFPALTSAVPRCVLPAHFTPGWNLAGWSLFLDKL